MTWAIFERAAGQYEAWYGTAAGRRADQAERALLEWLLQRFPTAASVLDVGCGTGHFTAWLATQRLWVVGLERAPAMVAEMRRRMPQLPAVLGDAHQLPFRGGAVDVVVFVTALEFLEEPAAALAEAVRVARQGVVVVALNRWSLGGLSRRWGPQAKRPLLSQARDYSIRELRILVRRAAGPRLQAVSWASTLLPDGFWRRRSRLAVGDVLGLAAVLAAPCPAVSGRP
ncbi:MAG TPA: methyltransferase domain-containing protein [Alphaproteobacteria bacterium]|nr:methyltransferase domain-containing protein [Alphaproteobacteria bacterium]